MSNEMENNPAPEEARVDVPPMDATEPAISPGRVLAKRREELNLTVEQIAGQLNLAPRQVEAIEADNFNALPGMAIARGFVRSYAKLVGIDAEPLLAAMAPAVAAMPSAHPASQAYISKPLSSDRLSFGQRNAASSKSIWVVVGLVAAGVAIAAAMQFGAGLPWSDADDATVADPAATTPEPAQQEGRAVEVLPTPDLPGETESNNPAAAPAEPAAAPAPQSAAPAAPVAAVPVPKAEASQDAAAVDEKNALVLRMREQSWVEIKRPGGPTIAARVFDAGSVETIPLKGELELVVGNAGGVDASLRGESLDLQARARGNVARLSVK